MGWLAWALQLNRKWQKWRKWRFPGLCLFEMTKNDDFNANSTTYLWYFESFKQCKCARPHLETQPWTCSGFLDSSNSLLNSQNYSVIDFCLNSCGKWKNTKNSLCCSFPQNFAWVWKGLNELCSFFSNMWFACCTIMSVRNLHDFKDLKYHNNILTCADN